ncbi:MAG: hypothetical protein ACRDWY_08870, partial [Actinomycetes bacterium]
MRGSTWVLLVLLLLSGCVDDVGSGGRTAGRRTTPVTTAGTASPTTATPPASPTATRNRELDRPLLRAAGRGDADRVARLLAGGASV